MAAESSPQPLVVGELIQNNTTTIPNQKENTIIQNNQLSYAASLIQTNSVFLNQTNLKQFEVIHGVPTIQFTKEERLDYAKEEGLHQAIVVKLSSNKMELSTLRNLLPKILGIKGQALIGQLAPRQILIRMDQFDDFGTSLARSVLYLNHNGREHQIRVFPWSIDFNVMEETTKAVVWISMPNLPPELFAKKALLSIASAVGMPISIDKATQVKSRPSVARVKVILDLKDKLPEKVALQFVDEQTGKINEFCQDLVYDNLPLYCFHCKHQGHDENTCRKLNGRTVANAQAIVQVEEKIVTQGEAKTDMNDGAVIEKLQGDENGVTEVLNGVTEVIDPLGELTTTGKGKKDNKSTCTWSQSSVQHEARRKESDTIIDEGSFGHKGIGVHQLKEKDDKHGGHPSIETASLVKVSIEDKIAFSPKVAGHVSEALLEDVGRGNGQRARLISQKDEAAGPLKGIKNTIHTTSKGGNAQVAQQDKVAGQVNNTCNAQFDKGAGHVNESQCNAGHVKDKVADHVNESHAQIDSAVGQSEHLKGIDAGNGKAKQMVGHVKAKEAENMEQIGKAHAVLMTAEMEQMVGHVKAKEAKNLEQIDGHVAGHVNEKAAENMEHKLINFAGHVKATTFSNATPDKGPSSTVDRASDGMHVGNEREQQVATSHGVQQKKLLLLQKATANATHRATDGATDITILKSTIALHDATTDGVQQNSKFSVSPVCDSKETVLVDDSEAVEDQATRAARDRASSDTPANMEKESHPKGQLILAEIEHNKSSNSITHINAKKFAGVGLNTSNHEVPTNESFDRSINHSHNKVTLSMISSATKNPRGGTDHTSIASEDETSDEFQEAVDSKRKSWADIAEEHDEGEENSQDCGSSTRQGGKGNEGAVALNEQAPSEVAAQYNLTPTNVLQAIVNQDQQEATLFSEREQSHVNDVLFSKDAEVTPDDEGSNWITVRKSSRNKQSRHGSGSVQADKASFDKVHAAGARNANISSARLKAKRGVSDIRLQQSKKLHQADVTPGKQQSNTSISAISLEDKKLLDALGSPKPHNNEVASCSKTTAKKRDESLRKFYESYFEEIKKNEVYTSTSTMSKYLTIL